MKLHIVLHWIALSFLLNPSLSSADDPFKQATKLLDNTRKEAERGVGNVSKAFAIGLNNINREASTLDEAVKAQLSNMETALTKELSRRVEKASREYSDTVARLNTGKTTWRDLEVFRDNSRTAAKVLAANGMGHAAAICAATAEAVEQVLTVVPSPDNKNEAVVDSVRSQVEAALQKQTNDYSSLSLPKKEQPQVPWKGPGTLIIKENYTPREMCMLEISSVHFQLEKFLAIHRNAPTPQAVKEAEHNIANAQERLQTLLTELPKVSKPVRFEHTKGSFVKVGDLWTEYRSDVSGPFTFEEAKRDDTYLYLRDDSREVNLKLPLAGGTMYWHDTDGPWKVSYTVQCFME